MYGPIAGGERLTVASLLRQKFVPVNLAQS